MSLVIDCPNCSSQFKAPDRVAGRSVRCLKCNTSIDVPSLQTAPPPAAPSPFVPLPAASPDSISAELVPDATTWLKALLVTGIGVAFFLAIAVVVILVNRQAAGVVAGALQPSPPVGAEQANL